MRGKAGSISTLLVEDQEIVRLGVKALLQEVPEVEIVAEATDGKSAVQIALEVQPELVLMDIGLPIMDGIEATKNIRKSIQSKIILITSHEQAEDIFAGLEAGADAYCLKTMSSTQLSTAIHSVMQGAVWLDPGISKHVLNLVCSKGQIADPAPLANDFNLSEREIQVLQLLVDGSSNQQIADQLYLSTETVKTHMRHLMEKLRVSDRTQAAVKAVRNRLVS